MNTSTAQSNLFKSVFRKEDYLIFLVEDNNLYAQMLKNYLKYRSNLKVMHFESGEECMKQIALKPAAVILDQHLPGMSGLETLMEIKKASAGSEVIFLSSDEEKSVVLSALKQGVYDYLVKEEDSAIKVDTALTRILGGIQNKRHSRTQKLTKEAFLISLGIAVIGFISLYFMYQHHEY
jgi:DNA-binding response OmpR family regulator